MTTPVIPPMTDEERKKMKEAGKKLTEIMMQEYGEKAKKVPKKRRKKTRAGKAAKSETFVTVETVAVREDDPSRKVKLDGISLTLASPVDLKAVWIGSPFLRQQLEAAWLRLTADEQPMSPRLVGPPGLGKTTLAYVVGRELGRPVYIFQCTMETRPEDLLVTPVISGKGKVEYRASSLLTAVIKGGVAILDEGNRMNERAWASLAPLLDDRRYVESIVAGLKVRAHPEFRVVTTMNDDASTYELPEYIRSRLRPRIEVSWPDRETEEAILRANLPRVPAEVVTRVLSILQKAHKKDDPLTTRDGISVARFAGRLIKKGMKAKEAIETALDAVADEVSVRRV